MHGSSELLPGQTETSGSTHKLSWRDTISDDWKKVVNDKEYREQVSVYADVILEMTSADPELLRELMLTETCFRLSSDATIIGKRVNLPEKLSVLNSGPS